MLLQVLLWSYPDCDRPPLAVQTEHAANIFGVQFLPCTNNEKIVTGAMDDTVMLHHLDRSPAKACTVSSGLGITRMACRSTLYGCHRARVKVHRFLPQLTVLKSLLDSRPVHLQCMFNNVECQQVDLL